ncbi:MAG: DUF2309 domain-containing protein [Bryobacterales bacterium]
MLRHTVRHLTHLLPAQGPIGVFVHHNTLHAFQHMPFEQAVVEAAKTFGTEPYLSEAAYLRDLERGRIRPEDLDFVLNREEDAVVLKGRLNRRALRGALLQRGLRPISAESVEWALEEGGLLDRYRVDLTAEARSLLRDGAPESDEAESVRKQFQVCRTLVCEQRGAPSEPPLRPRDGLKTATGVDLDDVIHPLLIRLCAVFLDQGQAYWPMPGRDAGLLAASQLVISSGGVFPEYLAGLDSEMARQMRQQVSAEQVIEDTLSIFGVPIEEAEPFLKAELLALPAWPGMINQLELRPELAEHEQVPASVMEYLALRLTLNKVAAANVSRRFNLGLLAIAWRRTNGHGRRYGEDLASAARLMDVAQLVGLSAADLSALDTRSVARLVREVEIFDDLERRRLYHLAYERRHEILVLSPLAKHARRPRRRDGRPAAQVFFCVDDRAESMRRHLEEIDPAVETFGAVGFFGAVIDYTGLDDAVGSPLCPVVAKPQHAVIERPNQAHEQLHETRVLRRKLWSHLARGGFMSSRMLVRGWLSASVLGLMSLFPLTARVLAPRTYGKLRKKLNAAFLPQPRTEIVFMRGDEEGKEAARGLYLGFTVAERVAVATDVLAPAGLIDRFARIVVILGHGSTSLNNPLESAYNCGACGGRRGGPNARVFAALANQPEVRAGLLDKAIRIPDDTWFVGGYHDTCTDEIELFDLDQTPPSHKMDLERIQKSLEKTRALDAHERLRRFELGEECDTPELALRHVEERAEHLSEPRPEYGHCTNAVCVIGKRSLTRGLFLDRRTFLTSYDAAIDPEDDYLTALLGAAIPVCGGINLEYYFSCIDNEGYGCGTKLPHNVVSLLGVMNGHASDLRTGLSSQMIEIHEPVRLLCVVETTPERLIRAVKRNPVVTELVENSWVRVVAIDSETGVMHAYRDGKFELYDEPDVELPRAETSVEWYRGKSEHLPIARIEQGMDLVSSPMEAHSA